MKKKYYGSLLSSIYFLNPIYEDILNHANNYPIFRPTIPPISLNKMLDYINDFLNQIDPNLLALFNRVLDKRLIAETEISEDGGRCTKLDSNNFAIIIKYNLRDFFKVASLVHEIGHAYYYYLNDSIPTFVRSNIANESVAKILEYLFIEYLRMNHLVDENSLNQYDRFFMTHHLNIMNSVYIVNKLIMDDAIEISGDPFKMKVEIPNEAYYNLSIVKIKTEEVNHYTEFDKNFYAYAFMLAMIMRENYVEDQKETIKIIKELPQLAADTDALEFIDLFDKSAYLNATKSNLSRVLSITRYKQSRH